QRLQRLLVEAGALRLAIGAAPAGVRSGARIGTLVPVDPQPGKLRELPLGHSGSLARPVQILDPEREAAARPLGPQPGEQGGTGVAEVELTGGARGEPPTDVHGRGFARLATAV